MTECASKIQKTVPLYRAVAAAVMDTHEDLGRAQQKYFHWGARGLKKITRESLKTGKRNAILTVNRNTNTATLPPDFDYELGVYVISDGKKVPLSLRPELVDTKNIEEIECEDKCPACNQDKKICEDLSVTEDTVLVVINDSTYEQTIIKRLYPDGSYFLETRTPVWDVPTESVIYRTNKELVTALDLKPCGCIDDTEENIEKIKCNCYDVYCQYYAPCDTCCDVNYGGYRVFEESGLIQFDAVGKFRKVYIEYKGFIPKKNGQYQIPEVAFETIVEWIKYKSIQNRKNVTDVMVRRWFDDYKRERENMMKVLGRISLSAILDRIGLIPKFDVDHYVCEPYSGMIDTTGRISAAASAATSGSTSGSSSDDSDDASCDSDQAVCPPTSSKSFTPFAIAVIAGNGAGTPTPGINTYQNDKLKNALDVNMIIVNNSNETVKAQQFTLDTATGIISRWQGDGVTPNDWQAGDVLIVPTFFKLI